jgi:tetratricopeptide (TPR) repeat protein
VNSQQPVPQDVREMFAAAFQHHQAGRFSEAERLYRDVLAVDPRHADSLHLLGGVACQTGRHELAFQLIGSAIAINTKIPFYHANLGGVMQELGRLDEAVAYYQRALDLDANYAEAHYNMGITLRKLARLDDAVACYRRAIDAKPNYPEAYYNLGNALMDLGASDDAVVCYRTAVELRPNYAAAHSNLGNALRDRGRLDDAIACYRVAIELRPGFLGAHHNLGVTFAEQGRLHEAIACYLKAIDLKPDSPDAHWHLALALLAQGDMSAGWEEYEWRWQTPKMIKARRNFAQPQWRGETAVGRTLLIHAEQGFGDTLQFCRYGPLAAARGLRVMMEVQKPLVRLLRGLPDVELVVARGDELPPFDLHCPMLSMPLAMGTTMATIPSAASYLHADAAQVAAWRKRLAAPGAEGFSIGLAWTGNAAHAAHRRRSIAPDRLTPLFEQAGLRFFSLQKGGTPAPANFPLTDFMPEMGDFADTAALISNLDLVISVDTAVAHLAAALGKPVWLLDRFDSDFRWFTGRRDSPWYPTLRLYRQPRPGDWDSVLAEVVHDLQAWREGGMSDAASHA